MTRAQNMESARIEIVMKMSPKVSDKATFNCIEWKRDVNSWKMVV